MTPTGPYSFDNQICSGPQMRRRIRSCPPESEFPKAAPVSWRFGPSGEANCDSGLPRGFSTVGPRVTYAAPSQAWQILARCSYHFVKRTPRGASTHISTFTRTHTYGSIYIYIYERGSFRVYLTPLSPSCHLLITFLSPSYHLLITFLSPLSPFHHPYHLLATFLSPSYHLSSPLSPSYHLFITFTTLLSPLSSSYHLLITFYHLYHLLITFITLFSSSYHFIVTFYHLFITFITFLSSSCHFVITVSILFITFLSHSCRLVCYCLATCV